MIVYAHRGARGYAPENTMASFERALQFNTDGIELDVHLSKDGHVVICHDHTINRTSNAQGLIRDFTLRELKSYDFGSWYGSAFKGEQILTLSEFLEWYAPKNKLLNIEIKNGPIIYSDIEEKVIDILHKFNAVGRTIISSFYHPSLKKAKELDNQIKTGILFECRPINPLQMLIEANADYLHPYWQSLDKAFCQHAAASGVSINTYTINTCEEYNFAAKLGVNAIFTDYPALFITRT
ncbi:glycerophosphodiester phosphodiesterase [Dendrosporobacter sp. 1207_IL3150]|uniref:glycerophosphodiester phosphodiesterase n=1 Tax=Dendrosporobacter sp. 1207_IL3150 TaxID=3084054 RepID=UPI002FD8ABDB